MVFYFLASVNVALALALNNHFTWINYAAAVFGFGMGLSATILDGISVNIHLFKAERDAKEADVDAVSD